MVTIKDMAQQLGISTTTVSNVIHGKTGEVSQRTVERVQELLKAYDYVPNISARNLASNRSGILGIVLKEEKGKYENLLQDPFYGEMVGVIEKEVRRRGYFLMMYISDKMQDILQYVSTWNADGLILVSVEREDYELLSRRYQKPKVTIDCGGIADGGACVNIGLEDEQGGFLIGSYLAEKGHKNPVFLCNALRRLDLRRYEGFTKAWRKAGLLREGEQIRVIALEESGSMQEGLERAAQLIGTCDVFVCSSDYYASSLENFLLDQGHRIPEEVSVTGFDDNYYARMVRPALTTIHQDPGEKGRLAVACLENMIEGKEVAGCQLKVRLVERDSVKSRMPGCV